MYSVIFRNVLVLCYIRGIYSRSSHKDKCIRHLQTSSQGSIHIDPLLLVMGVYAKCICNNVPIPFWLKVILGRESMIATMVAIKAISINLILVMIIRV